MRRPHVAALWYQLTSPPTRLFSDTPSVERYTDAFYIRLDKNEITVWMREHHATKESARRVVEKYLRSWEISAALEYRGQPDIRFEFVRADIVDLDTPPPSGPGSAQVIIAAGSEITAKPHRLTVVSDEAYYPSPPDKFVVTPDVDVLWTLCRMYREDRYPLLPMTYSFVTYLEVIADGSKGVQDRYYVSSKVLSKLSNLSSIRGIGSEARKHTRGERQPATEQEKQWIEAALRALIRRVGEVAYDDSREWPKITRDKL